LYFVVGLRVRCHEKFTFAISSADEFLVNLYVHVCICGGMIVYQTFVNMISSYKLLVWISPNLQLWCSWGQRWTDYIFRSETSLYHYHPAVL